ncbi:hypothetical protein M9434_000514 [Picochlorum sp. BPE23]|nr:hypothetical protein M9434_000514 [Picochlorum sp. BPE23]
MASTLKVSSSDGVKVYSVAGGKSIPSWVSDAKKKSLRKDEEYRKRIELIQDFEFPAACQRIKATPDGQYIFATGYHPPRVRVYDLSQLSMKFERYLDSEIVDFQILSEDYSKAVFLCADRSLHFHAKFGAYYRVRVPRFGRDLAYSASSAELLVTGSAPEVYRLNLSEGRFLSPLQTRSSAINACGISPSHGLFACAGEDGGLECFDVRQRESLGWMNAAAASGADGQQLTAVRFDQGGLNVAVGTSGGIVSIFDLRSSKPMITKDHMYDSPIIDLKFQTDPFGSGTRHVVSSDKHIIKIWDADTGEAHTNIEPGDGSEINDVALWKDSGLIMAGCDSSRIQAYFIPSLGPAPPWCSFLENLTEEMEENHATGMYDDYRFVTKGDLEKLSLTHLIGTPMLRAYMHGYFIDNRLYNKAKSIADPFAYETYKKKKIEEKLEEERKSRISAGKKLPKVNATTAARLILEEQSKSKKKKPETNVLHDPRFAAMFEDPEFTIDVNSEEFKQLHPNTDPAKDKKLLAEHFEQLEEESSPEPSHDEEYHNGDQSGSDEDDEVEVPAGHRRAPKMYVAKDEKSARAYTKGKSLQKEREMPLGMRSVQTGVRKRVGGSNNKEITFVPRMAPDKKRNQKGARKPKKR